MKGVFTGVQSLICIVSMILSITTGCDRSSSFSRSIVAGTVTYQGHNVEKGAIRFIPQGEASGPIVIEPIDAGRYRCARAGGVPQGRNRVEILAFDPSVPPTSGPGQIAPKQLLPAKYNRHSELLVEVPGNDRELIKNFELTP